MCDLLHLHVSHLKRTFFKETYLEILFIFVYYSGFLLFAELIGVNRIQMYAGRMSWHLSEQELQ